MTFDANEISRSGGAPITLFKATYGAATPITWTDAVAPVTYDDGGGSLVYATVPTEMDQVVASGSLDKVELQIRVPENQGLAQLFLIYPPPEPVAIIVRHGHFGDAEFKLAFSGVVLAVGREEGRAILACEPVSSALGRPGLRRNYQFPCPYVLYQGLCTASKAAATTAITAQVVNPSSITVTAGWEGANALADYLGGTVEWVNTDGNTEIRTILNAQATEIRLSGLTRDLSDLDSVNVVLGCNRSEDHCLNLHNVIADFGGQSFIPVDGPYEFNNFY